MSLISKPLSQNIHVIRTQQKRKGLWNEEDTNLCSFIFEQRLCQLSLLGISDLVTDNTRKKLYFRFHLIMTLLFIWVLQHMKEPSQITKIISSDRSSCTDDGLLYIYLYIYPATFSDFEHLCLSILLQVSL